MSRPASKATLTEGVAQWPELEPATREHTLPTGRTIVLHRGLSMRRLVRQGVVPNAMLGIRLVPVDEVDGEDVQTRPDYQLNTRDLEIQTAAVVCAMAIDPPVVMEPVAGALLYDALEDDEINYVVAWAQEGLAGTARFSVEPEGDGDSVSGEGVGEVPE